MLTDTHAHLYDCGAAGLAKIVDEAGAAGVGMIVNTATSIDTARTVIEQCSLFPKNMRAAVGVSPFDTADINDNWADELKLLPITANSLIVAIGEIGLDRTNPRYPPLGVQMPIFLKQLEMAVETGLPAVIHSRGMEKRAAEICRETGVSNAIFHCFTGDLESLEYIVSCGYYISISGIITYKNSHLRDIVRHVPANRLLIETDTPYLSPAPHRGKPNKPGFLIHTAKELARILGVNEDQFFDTLRDNTDRAFPRLRKFVSQ